MLPSLSVNLTITRKTVDHFSCLDYFPRLVFVHFPFIATHNLMSEAVLHLPFREYKPVVKFHNNKRSILYLTAAHFFVRGFVSYRQSIVKGIHLFR